MQHPLQKALLGFRDVNPSERSLGQGVGRNQGQTVHAHLVDAVNGLEERSTGQEGLLRPDTLHSDVGVQADQLKAARKIKAGQCTG